MSAARDLGKKLKMMLMQCIESSVNHSVKTCKEELGKEKKKNDRKDCQIDGHW